jgi:hypothetical protein
MPTVSQASSAPSRVSCGTIVPKMDLSPFLSELANDTTAVKAGPAIRCAAANFRWEHAVLDVRASEYNAYVGEVDTYKDWKAEHKGYVGSFVQVPKDVPRCPESFMVVSRRAHLREQLDNTYLLRLESVGGLFTNPLVAGLASAFWDRFFRSQKDLRKTKLSDADEGIRSAFVSQWNAQRTQARPLFATFLNEFGGSLEQLAGLDWPHILRDRLGLTHLPSAVGKAIPVAMMCYTVNEVRQARALATKRGAVASFARPTVLDSEMSAAFVPGPPPTGDESYGYTLDLGNAQVPDSFTPELLTFPIDYKPTHIKALGFISRPHLVETDELVLAARNRHVQGLQRSPAWASFGEVLT